MLLYRCIVYYIYKRILIKIYFLLNKYLYYFNWKIIWNFLIENLFKFGAYWQFYFSIGLDKNSWCHVIHTFLYKYETCK